MKYRHYIWIMHQIIDAIESHRRIMPYPYNNMNFKKLSWIAVNSHREIPLNLRIAFLRAGWRRYHYHKKIAKFIHPTLDEVKYAMTYRIAENINYLKMRGVIE